MWIFWMLQDISYNLLQLCPCRHIVHLPVILLTLKWNSQNYDDPKEHWASWMMRRYLFFFLIFFRCASLAWEKATLWVHALSTYQGFNLETQGSRWPGTLNGMIGLLWKASLVQNPEDKCNHVIKHESTGKQRRGIQSLKYRHILMEM